MQEEQRGHLQRAATAGATVVEAVGVRPGQGDELMDVAGGKVVRHQHDHRHLGEHRDRRQRRRHVDGGIGHHEAQHCVGAVVEEQRVPVRRRAGHQLGRDDASAAHPVLDHDGLRQVRRHGLGQHAGADIGGATGREGHDQTDRAVREGQGRRRAQERKQAGNEEAAHIRRYLPFGYREVKRDQIPLKATDGRSTGLEPATSKTTTWRSTT
jgi:hypothetical protein